MGPHKKTLYAPGSRVEVSDDRIPETRGAGTVLYVGSDANVLVGWDDEFVAVLPQEALLVASTNGAPI